MKCVWFLFWLVVGAWIDIALVRLCGLVAWPWRWLLAPVWVPAAALLAFIAFTFALDRLIRVWVWFQDVRDARRRLRWWQRAQEEGMRSLFVDREQTLRRRDGLDALEGHVARPPFHRR